jgi:hypothetical protein
MTIFLFCLYESFSPVIAALSHTLRIILKEARVVNSDLEISLSVYKICVFRINVAIYFFFLLIFSVQFTTCCQRLVSSLFRCYSA